MPLCTQYTELEDFDQFSLFTNAKIYHYGASVYRATALGLVTTTEVFATEFNSILYGDVNIGLWNATLSVPMCYVIRDTSKIGAKTNAKNAIQVISKSIIMPMAHVACVFKADLQTKVAKAHASSVQPVSLDFPQIQ